MTTDHQAQVDAQDFVRKVLRDDLHQNPSDATVTEVASKVLAARASAPPAPAASEPVGDVLRDGSVRWWGPAGTPPFLARLYTKPQPPAASSGRPLFDPLRPNQGYLSDAEWSARKVAASEPVGRITGIHANYGAVDWLPGMHGAVKQGDYLYSVPPAPAASSDALDARRLRDALAELVSLKDLKDRLQQLHEMGHGTDYDDYHRRQHAAWDNARAAIKGEQP